MAFKYNVFTGDFDVVSDPSIGGTVTSGTPGSVLFVGGTTDSPTLSQDNQNLYFNNTTDRLSVFGSLGIEIISNGTFTGSASGWTVPSGMAYSSNSVSKTSNGTGALVQTTTAMVTSEYALTYTISNWTVGTITPSYGGWTGTAVSANGTYTERFVAIAQSNNLSFTPSNTARFTIDSISLKLLAPTSSTTAHMSVGGLNIQGSWSNSYPNTSRALTFNNNGSNIWVDYRLSGVLKAVDGVSSVGEHSFYASGGNYFAYYGGNSGITASTLFNYNTPTVFGHTGYGVFQYGLNAGSQSANTSTLQTQGGTALKVVRITASQSLDNTATHWLADATTPVCTGTPSAACSSWTNQTDCEKWDAHGGCTWFAGNACSTFNNENGMGSCTGQAGCTVVTASCVGPTDQTSCESQDDAYGGACSWGATGDCTALDEMTCGTTFGCTQNFTACSSYTSTVTCEADAGCDATLDGDCTTLSDGGGDGTNCATQPECSYDNGTGACTGSYFTSCSGTGTFVNCTGSYYACSGTYYTGTCSGTYGAACQGSSTCSGIDDSTNCGLETGCSWTTAINVTLPDGETCVDRTYWIKNDNSSGNDVNILPYSGQRVEGQTGGITLSQYGQAVHLAYYKQTYACSNYVTSVTCSAHTSGGCTVNMLNCVWDGLGMTCSGHASCIGIGDQLTCEATTYFSSCTGTEVIQKNWYIF